MKKSIYAFFLLYFSACSYATTLNLNDYVDLPLGKTPNKQNISTTDFQGKLLIVSFWASWCPPCIRELPVLDSIQKKLGDRIQVVAVNFKESSKRFNTIKKKLLPEISLLMTHDKRGVIGKKFGVTSLPHLLIIDKHGQLIYQKLGYDDEALDEIINIINEQLTTDKKSSSQQQ